MRWLRVYGCRTGTHTKRSMKKDLLQQHFGKSGFDEMQADALAPVFELFREEMATKHDLTLLRTELRGDKAMLRTEMSGELSSLRAEVAAGHNALRTEMATLKADLTWRFVALIALFSTVMTLLDVFVK